MNGFYEALEFCAFDVDKAAELIRAEKDLKQGYQVPRDIILETLAESGLD